MAFHVLHDSCSMANASASTTRGRSAEIHGSGFRDDPPQSAFDHESLKFNRLRRRGMPGAGLLASNLGTDSEPR